MDAARATRTRSRWSVDVRRVVLAGVVVVAAGCARPAAAASAPPAVSTDFAARHAAIQAQIDTGSCVAAEAAARALLAERGWHSGRVTRETLDALNLVLIAQVCQFRVQDSLIPIAERMLREYQRLEEPDSIGTAAAHRTLANLHRQLGHYAQAESAYVHAVALFDRYHPPLSYEAAGWLGDGAELMVLTGRYDEARRLMERSLESRVRRFGPESRQTAWALSSLAYLDQRVGQYTEAIRGFEAVLALRRRVQRPDHPHIAHTLNALANLYEGVGDYERAWAHAESALAIRTRAYGPESQDVARSLSTLASLARERGDYAAARPLSERALAIREKVFGPDHPDVATSLLNLAELRMRMGDHTAVRPLLDRALAIRSRRFGPGHIEVAIVRDHLSDLALAEGDARTARTQAAAGLASRRAVLGDEHPGTAHSLMRLAAADLAAGSTASARTAYARALELYRRAAGPRAPETGRCARLLGEVTAREGDLDAALALEREGLAIADSMLGAGHPEVAACWMAIARTLARSGDVAGALDAALRAEAIGREHLRTTIRSLTEREALRYAVVSGGRMDLAAHLAGRSGSPDHAARTLDALIRSRALVLDEMVHRQRALLATREPAVRSEEQRLRHDRDQLTHLRLARWERTMPRDYARLVDSLRTACERRERRLAERSAMVRGERARDRIGLDAVLVRLPAGSALVSYLRCQPPGQRGEYVAFVLRRGAPDSVSLIPLGDATGVDSLVARLRRNLARATDRDPRRLEPEYRDIAARLRRRVWDPVMEVAGAPRALFVVPDAALHLVNLAALPVGTSGYVVEGGTTIHRLATERDVVELSGRTYRGSGLLAFGAPDYDSTATLSPAAFDARRTRRTRAGMPSRFEPLPGSEEELREIARVWSRAQGDRAGGALSVTGPAATPEAFLKLAPGRRVLHCATHGFALDRRAGSGDRAAVATIAHPLELSGLALAGANGWRERAGRGLLTSATIASLDLAGTEWVVLSSCASGVGLLLGGEGVLGMQRAFQAAGAGTVITSLWEVEDLAARRWMRALYEARYQRGSTTAEATRAASLEVLRELRARGAATHPGGWGAFVATGDWR